MSIALFANSDFQVNDVASALRKEGIDVFSATLNSLNSVENLSSSVTHGVLIIPEQGVVFVGEQTSLVRKLLRPQIPLIICGPQMTAIDRQILIDCGAAKVITPQTWLSKDVAERVLGELLPHGLIHPSSFGLLQGATLAIRELYNHIQKISPLSEPILILGETGTGKELVAKEIHNCSGRPEPYLPINCAELSPELLGSELFGHEKGSFTGAMQSRKGLLIEAAKGTVFLDEIGELDLIAQAKLLRVLEDRKVRPIGANRWVDFHARIVLATNRDLREDCIEGKFRRDLFERINGFILKLPPLRERKGDIPLLVQHFIQQYQNEYSGQFNIPSGALDYLFRYDWPGNVRELRAMVRKAAVYSDSAGNLSAVYMQETVRGREGSQPQHVITFDPSIDTWRGLLHRVQARYFKAVLEVAGGNKDAAAKLSGLSRSQFYERLKELEKNHDESE